MLRVVLTAALLFAIHVSEQFITYYIEFILPPEQSSSIYIALFGLISLILSYFLARLVYDIGGAISTLLSEKPAYKQLTFFARVSFGAIAILVFLVTSLRLVSIRVAAVAGVAEWLASTLSGFTSILIAMIVALQVREIFGNYLAWVVLRFSDLIEAGDYINFSSEVLKVVRVGYSHTVLLNDLNEEIYVPNLRFLIESFRKTFSRRTRSYVDLRFTLPYSFPYEDVKAGVIRALQTYSEQHESIGISDYRFLISELSPYSVNYELRVKPDRAVFPQMFRSDIMRQLLKEFGEALATPALILLSERLSYHDEKRKE